MTVFFRVATLLMLLAGCTVAHAQGGYSIQLEVFTSSARRSFFDALHFPVIGVKADSAAYVYVVDGFRSYAEAEKARHDMVEAGFSYAITLKTVVSRIPVIAPKPYAGPAEGEWMPEAPNGEKK